VIVFLACVATIGAVASVLRLLVAWADYRRRWRYLPAHYAGKKGRG
jgi:hypothetical protein